MKSKYFILPLAIAALAGTSLTSCSDFLTEDPKGQFTPDGFFSNQSSVDAAVNALYFNVQQSQCNSNPLIVQCQGNDITSTTGSNKAAYLSADAFEVPSDTKGLEWLWKWQYNIIQAANLIIDNVDAAKVSESAINEAKGQAYFWRAYSYFSLVRVFGPLPMNLHNEDDKNATPLSSVEVVYQQIVEDLTNAEKCNLPTEYSGTYKRLGDMNVFITTQAVKSALAAVYMNMAGFPLNKGTEYYKLAADKAKEVVDGVNNGTYSNGLCADWSEVYSYGNNYSKEALVGIVYNSKTGGWSNYDSQMSSCHQFGSLDGGWGDFLPERHFWMEFPDGPRKDYVYAKQLRVFNGETVDWWATKDGKPYNEKTGEENNAVVTEYRPMFVAFTVNKDASGNPAAAPYDYKAPFWTGMCINKTHQIIRYSEVLCWFAESAARAGVYTSEAQAALAQVQARAYTTAPTNSDLAEAALREHGYEVAGYPYAMVTRRADEFRMNTLKEAWEYRHGSQSAVLVPAGTETHSIDANGTPFTYTLEQDVVLKENMDVATTWNGDNSIYQIYPPKETEKNPYLKR